MRGVDVETKLKEYQSLKYNKNNKFDIDLGFGTKFEKSLAKILSIGKMEVKTERDKWKKTRNIANKTALKYLNKWIEKNNFETLNFEEAASIGRQIELY